MPAHNAAATLQRCVAAVRDAVPAATELVIIDDGSFDDTREIARGLADRLVVLPCQSGAARARNEGIRQSTGEIIMMVDSDVLVNRAAVAGLILAMENGLDAVFGAYTPLPPPEARSIATNYKNHVHHATHIQGGRRIATSFWSGFSAIRRDAFVAVGGFDSAVTRSADVEDIHLGYRLTSAGFTIAVEPACQVEHLKRYTSRGLMASDLFHRAIPWTRAMLELRTFRSDLNLAGSSMAGVAMFLLGVTSAIAAPFTSPKVALILAGALVGGWLWTQRRLIRSCWNAGGPPLGAAAVAYGAAFCLYAPAGVVLGVLAYLLRPKNRSVRNTVSLEHRSSSDGGLALTIVVVTRPVDEAVEIDALVANFPPDPRYEVLLVTSEHTSPKAWLRHGHVRLVLATDLEEPRERCQRGLDQARGRSVVFLEPGLQPVAGWIEQAVRAGERGFLVTGGSFGLQATSPRARAAADAWFWQWRAQAKERWIEDHPTMNTVFDTAAIRQIGGLSDRASAYRRMSVFGARVVHFDPALRTDVSETFRHRTLRQRFGLSRAQAATMVAYYDNGLPLRVARIVHGTATLPFTVARRVYRTKREGTADGVYWRALPRIVVWSAADTAGSVAGYCARRRLEVPILGSAVALAATRHISPIMAEPAAPSNG